METNPPFDLNGALRARLGELSQSGGLQADDLEELEHHLRDSIAKLQSTGLSLEESFLRATSHLGGSETLAAEFLKVNPAQIWPSRILCLVAGATLFHVAPDLCDAASGILMRMLWRLPLHGDALGLLALILRWIPVLVFIITVGWWMKARGDSWQRATAACFQRPLLTTACLILLPMVVARSLQLVSGFIPSPFDWPEWGHFSRTDFARLAKVQMWSPWASFIPPGLRQEAPSEALFYLTPTVLIFLALVRWRGALSRQPSIAGLWAPRVLWLLLGAATVYSLLNLQTVWWVEKEKVCIYLPRVPWLMDEELPINGHLAGLFVTICWWGPLAASMLGFAWLAGATSEPCERAVTRLFRHPVLSALGLMAFPLVSTLLFRPVFADLAVGGSDAVAPHRLLTIFAWCHCGASIAPVCLALGLFVFLGWRRRRRTVVSS